MKVKERLKKERFVIPLMLKGYSRSMANTWYGKTQNDFRLYRREFGSDALEHWHNKGYLASSIKRYDLIDNPDTDYITDFQYIYMKPFNNSLGKWLEDIQTTERVLEHHSDHFRKVYFSLIRREGKTLLLRAGNEDREYKYEDLIELLREKGALELRPAFWESSKKRWLLTVEYDRAINEGDNELSEEARDENDEDYFGVKQDDQTVSQASDRGEEKFFANGEPASERWLRRTLSKLVANYVVADPVPIHASFDGVQLDHALKLWVTNDFEDGPQILSAMMNIYYNDEETGKRCSTVSLVDLHSGEFEFLEEFYQIPNWDEIKQEICRVSADIPQISFYTVSIALQDNAPFQFLRFSNVPALPSVAFNSELNDYLKSRFKRMFRKRTLKDRIRGLKERRMAKEVKKRGRKGIRPYMYKIWKETCRSDFWHTKGVSFKQKRWAHKHGFFSWHLYQYGITKDNYLQFLSDYDYFWLNRINNDYQKWVNDKTTFRMVMEPFKDYVPKYYFSMFKMDGKTRISKMWDCPEEIPNSAEGIIELLKEKGKLAMKASAGTHGDGFYCLSYENDAILINGKETTIDEFFKIIDELKSFYIVTEYLEMHEELKKIYSKSVNTVRMMVVNSNGYDPKIMQTYMRIGSEKTGFTDNVGYGGICVYVNKETGELYKPETIREHVFYDCPIHPDTGTPISGFLPHWDLVREKVLEICKYLCELEYLGFDIAITDEGFQILEINIHQDLHKVADFDDEIKEFFRRKLKQKRSIYKAY